MSCETIKVKKEFDMKYKKTKNGVLYYFPYSLQTSAQGSSES